MKASQTQMYTQACAPNAQISTHKLTNTHMHQLTNTYMYQLTHALHLTHTGGLPFAPPEACGKVASGELPAALGF